MNRLDSDQDRAGIEAMGKVVDAYLAQHPEIEKALREGDPEARERAMDDLKEILHTAIVKMSQQFEVKKHLKGEGECSN